MVFLMYVINCFVCMLALLQNQLPIEGINKYEVICGIILHR